MSNTKKRKENIKKKKKEKKVLRRRKDGWEDKCSIFEGGWVVEGVRHENRNVI
jgi:hypothetical protein